MSFDKSRALELLQEYVDRPSVGEFMGSDVRIWAEEKKGFVAPNPRQWGPVLKAGEKDGIIRRVGSASSKHPSSHSRMVVWVGANHP
jgi:hypothetical protein